MEQLTGNQPLLAVMRISFFKAKEKRMQLINLRDEKVKRLKKEIEKVGKIIMEEDIRFYKQLEQDISDGVFEYENIKAYNNS